MSVDVKEGATFHSSPKVLIENVQVDPEHGRWNYAVTAAGQYFYMLVGETSVPQIHVVLNWAAELARK